MTLTGSLRSSTLTTNRYTREADLGDFRIILSQPLLSLFQLLFLRLFIIHVYLTKASRTQSFSSSQFRPPSSTSTSLFSSTLLNATSHISKSQFPLSHPFPCKRTIVLHERKQNINPHRLPEPWWSYTKAPLQRTRIFLARSSLRLCGLTLHPRRGRGQLCEENLPLRFFIVWLILIELLTLATPQNSKLAHPERLEDFIRLAFRMRQQHASPSAPTHTLGNRHEEGSLRAESTRVVSSKVNMPRIGIRRRSFYIYIQRISGIQVRYP